MGACCCSLKGDNQIDYSSGVISHGRYCIPGCATCSNGVAFTSRTENQDSSSVLERRHLQTEQSRAVIRQNKSGPVQGEESQLSRVSISEPQSEDVTSLQNLKTAEDKSQLADSMPGSPEKLSDSTLPLADEEDVCPTCLEEYDEENPQITTKCDHHYHLSCILEWMERSDTCPICDQEMIFSETN
ncbi:E3 ubiquitin-protein ligase At3g02290 isoform X1 [Cryptomeria japonica]|uniref:E3 ubiquitin-protein ligase At3g02290 isoform X1 n=1 Tax=Cryptomeria japonica TaxID=3369 RepID=UPI0025AD998F|nr:E3 ubiquitin-protein ligase At3g02290 isoform X1 [Cryptomeria japonica]XP_057814922.1 E3 ubiquitin-protein ligase At3g02290 isoform X1 [Cryptomeria japonica]XP_057814923.1 E3 ubiquitin-protein ligase At3g02290 isoform X1 [Cryptomeria japonica]XP_057814924.1 E3 ubiquitin-protein ligase At3g02290 isoform X1 [Cryptomeria japonica]